MSRMIRKYGVFFSAACLALVTLSGCGRGGSTSTGTAPTTVAATATTGASMSATATTGTAATATTGASSSTSAPIKADLKDDAIVLSSNTASAGSVTFNVSNVSEKRPHELVVIKTDLAADKLPTNSDGAAVEDGLTGMGEIEDLNPGEGGDLTVDLPAGHYVLICNVRNHYSQGMRTEFTVK